MLANKKHESSYEKIKIRRGDHGADGPERLRALAMRQVIAIQPGGWLGAIAGLLGGTGAHNRRPDAHLRIGHLSGLFPVDHR